MSPLYLELLAAFLRWLLTGVGAYLVAHHIITRDLADSLTQDLVTHALLAAPIVASLAWSFWAKYRGRLKLVAANTLRPGASEEQIADRAKSVSAKEAFTTLAILLCLASSAQAQQPVSQGPNIASYVTAFVSPSVQAYEDIKTHDYCKLAQLATSELLGNVLDLGLKKIVPSQRPCAGCGSDGSFSGHTMNSEIGISSGWTVGISMAATTGLFRWRAHEHTVWQVLEGAALGFGAEYSGKLIRCR